MKKLFKGLLILMLLFTLLGCGKKKEEVKPKEDNTATTTTTTAAPQKEKVKITFDSDGGSKEEDLEIDLGSQVMLPVPKKDGYEFLGWYDGKEKVTAKTTFSKNTSLKAKWEKIIKTFKITFDSKGGTSVKAITVECGKDVKLPANPTREGYNFRAWVDKNGKAILNGAKLSCEDFTLYADWESKPTEVKVTYECPAGYTLNGDKCTTSKDAIKVCPTGTKEDGSICIKLTEKQAGTRECGKKTVHFGGGHTEEVQGVIYNAPYASFCYYGEVTSVTDKNTCTSQSRSWNSGNNKCYVEMDSNYTTTSCPNNYKYYSSADLLSKFGAHDGGGCFKVYDAESKCDADFTLISGKCVKTINATKK